MDPATRRYLWDVLINITKEGRSIILTSHRYLALKRFPLTSIYSGISEQGTLWGLII